MNYQNNQREVPFNEQPDAPNIPSEAHSGHDNFRSTSNNSDGNSSNSFKRGSDSITNN
ncbi:11854_t:CDS:2 [Entrophospora sp. SA101]|nr:12800_t:CDS:2 [Entrophospora sp. SA101]CAJ0628533.1 15819_t:CDS:2 [Entrophospora sp. SA101]CAJ0748804.1 11854_t:CDS:2 [Entrophospora sp. SA101]CAJ0909623.1 7116_t:CDS:2 [Entrophospora sp. SA101]CAJ0912006.1 16787_t:CDS:2 [Entrophospora sp. SA101]